MFKSLSPFWNRIQGSLFPQLEGSLLYLWIHDRITTGQVIQVFTTMWTLWNDLVVGRLSIASPLSVFWDRQASLFPDARFLIYGG